jgi:hypothetical protein
MIIGLIELIYLNLGPLLRWIRGGTTRRGNPWAAVVMTFLLVQVSFREKDDLLRFHLDF